MNNWHECELGSVVTLKRGYDLPQQKRIDGNVPIFSSSGISGYHNTPMVSAPGVITGRYGTIGQVFFSSIDYWPLNTTLYVEDFHGNDPLFIYYFLKTIQWEKYQSASAVPGINRNAVHTEIVSIPDKETQGQIADILAVLDKKIKNSQQINDNLLQQARALFQHWVSDTPSILYKLSEVADINPETYSPKESWSFVNYLDTSSITSGRITDIQYIKPSEEKLPSRARRIIRENDVVFSTVRPNQLHYGIIPLPKPNMLGSTGFVVIRSKKDSIPNEIIYLAITEPAFVEQMQQLAEQSVSTFPSIRPNDLDACIIPEPREEDADFVSLVQSIFKTVAENNEENERLSALRDALLPRLISGEIDVSNVTV